MEVLYVTRHPAALEFMRREMGDHPVMASVTAEDVAGKCVVGNVPLHLAAAAASVVVIEFTGAPPRGQEYTLAEMDAAGAHLARYEVRRVEVL